MCIALIPLVCRLTIATLNKAVSEQEMNAGDLLPMTAKCR